MLQHLDASTSAKAATKVIECQAVWLSAVGPSQQKAAHQAAAIALHSRPDLLDLYISTAVSKLSAPLVHLVWSYARKRTQIAPETSRRLVPVFIDSVLSAKERPSPPVLAHYARLLHDCPLDVVVDTLLPAALRMIRRSPEPALSASIFLFNSLSADLSGPAPGEVMPVLVQQARHAKEPVRKLSVEATKALALRIAEPSALASCCAVIQSTMDGTAVGGSGKIKSPQERASLVGALTSLASAPGKGKAIASAATSAVEFICRFYKEEITDEGKIALLRALGCWLPRCCSATISAGPPPAAVARLQEGLKESKEALRREHLRALTKALALNVEMRGQMGEVVPTLAKMIGDGASKVAARVDGIYAFLAAAYIASADAGADTVLEKENVWTIGGGAEDPLVSAVTAVKLTTAPEDAAALAELCGALLSLHSRRVMHSIDADASGSTAAVSVSRTLVLLLLHYAPSVRSAASAAASAVASCLPPELDLTLLSAIQYWLSICTNSHPHASSTLTVSPASVLQDPSEGEVPMAVEAVYERFLHALLSCIPRHRPPPPHQASSPLTTEGGPALVATALLLSHHPTIAASRRGGSGLRRSGGAWGVVARRLGGVSIVAEVIATHPEAVVTTVLAALNSPDPRQQTAAYGAFSAAAALATPELLTPLLSGLGPWLDRREHDALTPRQLRIYATPRGRTSNENEDGSIIPVELFEEMLGDKSFIKAPIFPPPTPVAGGEGEGAGAGGGAGATITTTAAAASKSAAVRPSIAASAAASKGMKPNNKGPAKDAAAEARARQIKAEAVVRGEVIAIREKLAKGLTALGAYCGGGNALFIIQHAQQIAAPALPLLTSRLVGSIAAFSCLRQLVGCIPGAPGWRSLDIAAALRLVAIADEDAGDAAAASAALPSSLQLSRLAEVGAMYQHLAEQRCVESSVQALLVATGGHAATEEDPVGSAGARPLPAPVYTLCFPILRAILSCPLPTPLHDAALSVVALHVGPDSTVSKLQAFELLHRVILILPALRDRVQVLLRELCASISADGNEPEPELFAALKGIVAPQEFARAATLAALASVPLLQTPTPSVLSPRVLALLWMAANDAMEENREAGKALWASSGAVLPEEDFISALVTYVAHDAADVRAAAAAALSSGLAVYPNKSSDAVNASIALYTTRSSGNSTTSGPSSSLSCRLGSAAALQAIAPHLTSSDVTSAMEFLLRSGLVDSTVEVRQAMVKAGVAIVDAAGPTPAAAPMLPLFDSYLERKAAGGGLSEEQYDYVRQGAVVFLGTLARHLDPSNPKVKSIIDTLIEVLKTPSESVQRSVSDCLPPLLSALQGDKEFVDEKVQLLLNRALHGETYGDRRGAAYGLAGAVKGLGLSSLKSYGVMDALKAGVEDKSDAAAREGALCSFECLSDKLGRLFEPYVVSILATLLESFGDPSPDVRDAANGASRVIMGQLSAQGVKLVLPKLLQGVEARQWRTKQGSIQLLGAMAYCAPKQLSVALPTIVPRLGQVLADPHPKVCAAAKEALDEVGSVIRNPEVARLVPTLLAAIANPDKNNKKALDTLLSTVFVNTVDAASLALIVPVVHRGLRDRSGDVKKRAARIVGNLCKLVNDPKDMAPYVTLLLPEVQAALLDPLPEVRATASKALGALTMSMGAEALGDTEPWLLEKMHSDSSAVERSGAAQGLAEVLAVQGAGALEAVLPHIIAGCSAQSPAAREGSLTIFKYLPYAMPDVFRPYLPEMLPCVLDGLADESEGVRDASLSAGRVAVELYSNSALPLLLPTVEAGTQNVNWRIRQSSIELLGDLLFKVAGTSGRIQQDVHDEEGEGISVEAHGKAILEALGAAKRNEVLARVYIARSDVAYTVRSAALHVWKTLVTNTPKTLNELLPALMGLVIDGLASGDEDRTEMSSRCLGELVRKMGDRVLNQIVPILKEGMGSESAGTRAGVCDGLKEVMENSTRHQLAEHLGDLLPAVQGALCDEDAAVRAAAGGVINTLFKSGGGSTIDSIIPSLLNGLDSRDEGHASQALEGLRVVLGVRPQLLSQIAPRLISVPETASNLKALGALAEVAGPTIHSHLHVIMPTLLTEAGYHPDVSPVAAAAANALASVAGAVQEDGLHLFMSEIHKGLDEGGLRRNGAAAAIVAFCKTTKLDYQEHLPGLLSSLIPLLTEDDPDCLLSIWNALSAVMASIPKEMAPSFVRTVKEAVQTAKEKEKRKYRGSGGGSGGVAVDVMSAAPPAIIIPGFSLPKALAPILPVYLQGVLQGSSAELRELSAEGLGELIEVTNEDSLKPFVVQITGPLIRIIGDRFPWQTKAAILKTMGGLVQRAGVGLRPFLPQLQSTFVKCLADPAQGVRQCAAKNLGELTRMALRLDQLVSELAVGAATAEPAIAEAYLTALEGALVASGDRLSAETLSKVGNAVQEAMVSVIESGSEEEGGLGASAGAVGAYCARCPEDELRNVLERAGPLAPLRTGKYGERLGAALAAAAVARRAASRLLVSPTELRVPFVQSVVRLAKDQSMEVKQAAGKAAGYLVAAELNSNSTPAPSLPAVTSILVALLGPDQHTEVQKQALAVLRTLSTANATALVPYYPDIVPSILTMIQDTSGSTKLAAERTLARVLQLDHGPEATQAYLGSGKAGSLAKGMLTEAYSRRLGRLPGGMEEDDLAQYKLYLID